MSGPTRAAARPPREIAATAGPTFSGPFVRPVAPAPPSCCPPRAAPLVLPCADKEAMTLHLAEISRAVAPGAHAVVIIDGAGWHKPGGRLKLPDNISTLTLPPYSPELNPQENIWQYLRQNYLSNQVFGTYTAIVDACCAAWNALVRQPDQITSIASRDWARQVKSWCRWYDTQA